MSAKPDGGPAFPGQWYQTHDGYERRDPGMSLRDYFAAKALGGFCAMRKPPVTTDEAHSVAFACYALADAMLAERAK